MEKLDRITPLTGMSFLIWIGIVMSLAVVGGVVCALVAGFIRNDLKSGFTGVFRAAADLFTDLLGASPRRIGAIGWHVFMEAYRKRIWLVLVFFAFILLFLDWYLAGYENQTQLLISFVLKMSAFFAILVGIFTAGVSLPMDISTKTIHTVLTKPVRRLEIIVGRVCGYGALMTILLALMGGVSLLYCYAVVQVPVHEELLGVGDGNQVQFFKDFSFSMAPNTVEIQAGGETIRDDGYGLLEGESFSGEIKYDSGAVELQFAKAPEAGTRIDLKCSEPSSLVARVPLFPSRLSFDREVNPEQPDENQQVGISVGKEWDYRRFIRGASTDVATWEFRGYDPADFTSQQAAKVEMTLSVFRTTKGDMTRSVLAEITVVNPTNNKRYDSGPFEVREYRSNTVEFDPAIMVPAEGQAPAVNIECRCLDPEQHVGMARRDAFLMASSGNFAIAFLKSYITIWCESMLVVALAVTSSAFLKLPVSVLLAFVLYFSGNIAPFMHELAAGEVLGGGPLESLIRIVEHSTMQEDLDPNSLLVKAALGVDQFYMFVLKGIAAIIPDLENFDFGFLIANGFDVPMFFVLRSLIMMLGYVIPCILVGYFLLRAREIAK